MHLHILVNTCMATKPLLLVINLKKRTDRLKNMRGRLKDLDYKVVEAVSGDNLDLSVKKIKSSLSNNEKGCISSHITALEIFLQTNHDTCCILEDDVILGSDFFYIIQSYLNFPKNTYILKLETMYHKVWVGKHAQIIGNLTFKRLFSHHYGTAGYITSRSGAKSIIQALSKFDMPADEIIFHRMLLNKTYGECLQLEPACCVQEFLVDNNNESDIDEGRDRRLGKDIKGTSIDTKKKKLTEKAFREFKRLKKQISFSFYRLLKISSRIYTTINFEK